MRFISFQVEQWPPKSGITIGIWAQGDATTKPNEGPESSPGPHLYVDGPPWGEEKAGFGAQPRDFDGLLALWPEV